jgi:hypothetical protein
VSQFASFEEDWNPKQYLEDYYSVIEQDESETLRFLIEEFKKIQGYPTALEFGCGPVVAHLLPLASYVSEIHVADYLQGNLAEVRKWQSSLADAHNWACFTKFVLEHEGLSDPDIEAVKVREELLKSQITKYSIGDARHSNPVALGDEQNQTYDFLLSCYCADGATSVKSEWFQYMENILSLLSPGGYFVGSSLRLCQAYKIKDFTFPGANVNEGDWEELFQILQFERVQIKVSNTPDHASQGYNSILLVSGHKPQSTS